MTVSIPQELQAELQARANRRQISLDDLVGEALRWYLGLDAELSDELMAWQELRDEAWENLEGSLS